MIYGPAGTAYSLFVIRSLGGDKAPLCRYCHMNVTVAMLHVPRSLLSVANEEFARKYGLDWYLDQRYGRAATLSPTKRSDA